MKLKYFAFMKDMAMCEIAWCNFSWQALATLITGVLAVAGAFVIGRKQVSIAGRQVQLAEVTLRNSIFQQRFAIYEVMLNYIIDALQTEKRPSNEATVATLDAVRKSRFLFRDEVHTGLQKILATAGEFFGVARDMASKPLMLHKDDPQGPEIMKLASRSLELQTLLSEYRENLWSLFGDEMQLRIQ